MPDPVAATFDFLATTDNVHAVDALLPALDSDEARIRNAATLALLKRNSARGHMELVRRLESLCPEMRTALVRSAPKIDNSLRQCLLHVDPHVQYNALELTGSAKEFGQFSTLLNLLEDKHNPRRHKVVDVILELVNALYDHFHRSPEAAAAHAPLRDASRIREQVIANLEFSCNQYEVHGADVVVECLLALADVEQATIKKLLRQSGHPCRDVAERLLLSSTHPGVMSKITDLMSLNYPPPKVLQAVRQRTDPEFIAHLLRSLPKRLSHAQQDNYKSIDEIAWLQEYPLRLEVVPPFAQRRLVDFVRETGIPDANQKRVIDWIVKFGVHEARQAATEILSGTSNGAVQEIVVDGLYSDDAEVQAWATGQLRTRGIPQAFALLIERLDSPLAEVRKAARAELGDFNLKRVLELFDQMEPHTCILAGQLMRKIDPDALKNLKTEMVNPMRSKRIRAIQAAQALQFQSEVSDVLLKLLDDEDAMVRRTAVEVIAAVPSPPVIEALHRLLEDPSSRVRHEAERVMHELETKLEAIRSGSIDETELAKH